MASKAKPMDIRRPTGGKARLGLRQDRGSSAGSDGESPPSSPDEEHDDGCFEVPVKKQKMCPETQRPDLDVAIVKFVEDKVIIRSSQVASHVLVMGSPDMMLVPLRCPYEDTGCGAFYARAPQLLKEHLESKHKLHSVQLNFVCPCPAVCNIIDGEPRECDVVEYDPGDGVLTNHLLTQHKEYDEKLGLALCFRPHPGDPPEGAPMEYEVNGVVVKPDMDYLKHLNSGKTFPAWTKKESQLFPSQRIAQKVTIEAVILNNKISYACNVRPCVGKIFVWRGPRGIGMHLSKDHTDVLGNASQTQWFERCKACGVTMHWSHFKMILHMRAVHPELLGEPKHFVQQALEERERLQAQIQKVCVGQAIADTATPGNESDGTKAHMLYRYICPVAGCKKGFDKSDYAKWHIIVDHEKQWNLDGKEQSEVKSCDQCTANLVSVR